MTREKRAEKFAVSWLEKEGQDRSKIMSHSELMELKERERRGEVVILHVIVWDKRGLYGSKAPM